MNDNRFPQPDAPEATSTMADLRPEGFPATGTAPLDTPAPLPRAEATFDASPWAFELWPAGVKAEPVTTVPDEASTTFPAVERSAEDLAEPTLTGAWVRMWREVVSGLQTLVSAAVYATLIVTFGFQVARVDGLSMAPTLEDHDRLIVNKLVYELGDPRPGDIVMLYYPLNPEKMFVKRVIAKEGDTVRIVDGHVYVNDIPLRDDYVPVAFRSHDDWGPQVIQQGYYFVMGDHRNNSSDSRHWGSVPKKYIVGKVKVRWWPLQDARLF
jgi:signal peptidase I